MNTKPTITRATRALLAARANADIGLAATGIACIITAIALLATWVWALLACGAALTTLAYWMPPWD